MCMYVGCTFSHKNTTKNIFKGGLVSNTLYIMYYSYYSDTYIVILIPRQIKSWKNINFLAAVTQQPHLRTPNYIKNEACCFKEEVDINTVQHS